MSHLHGKEDMIPQKKGKKTLLLKALCGIIYQLRQWMMSSSGKNTDLFFILTNQTRYQWNGDRWISSESGKLEKWNPTKTFELLSVDKLANKEIHFVG